MAEMRRAPYVQPPGPRNLTQEYDGGGATSTVPGYPVGGGNPVPSGSPDALIRALMGARRQVQGPGVQAAQALEAPRGQTTAPGHEGSNTSPAAQMQRLQLQQMQAEMEKERASPSGGIWKQNGPYGMQNVSPGTPGSTYWQSGR